MYAMLEIHDCIWPVFLEQLFPGIESEGNCSSSTRNRTLFFIIIIVVAPSSDYLSLYLS